MPRPVQFCRLFAAALLFAAVIMPLSAHAEMTEADRAGQRAFIACLDENDADDEACLEKLGRYAWYPRDEAACETVAVRIQAVLADGAVADHKDLFFNERCARLEMPYNGQAAKAEAKAGPENVWAKCVREETNPLDCEQKAGLRFWQPMYEDSCEYYRHTSSVFNELGWTPDWRETFIMERCWRLGRPHFVPSQ